MGFPPDRCVVVEDSEVGLRAAAAAGMRTLHYAPELQANPKLSSACFSNMAELPRLLDVLSRAAQWPNSQGNPPSA